MLGMRMYMAPVLCQCQCPKPRALPRCPFLGIPPSPHPWHPGTLVVSLYFGHAHSHIPAPPVHACDVPLAPVSTPVPLDGNYCRSARPGSFTIRVNSRYVVYLFEHLIILIHVHSHKCAYHSFHESDLQRWGGYKAIIRVFGHHAGGCKLWNR